MKKVNSVIMINSTQQFLVMKKLSAIILVLALFISLTAPEVNGQSKGKASKNAPVFLNAVYQGDDKVYKDNPLGPDEFYNPILQGCYPDPAITRKGDDYYMVCSSFAMFPGLPF